MKQDFYFKFHGWDDTDLEQLLLIYKQISMDSLLSILQRFHMQTICIPGCFIQYLARCHSCHYTIYIACIFLEQYIPFTDICFSYWRYWLWESCIIKTQQCFLFFSASFINIYIYAYICIYMHIFIIFLCTYLYILSICSYIYI